MIKKVEWRRKVAAGCPRDIQRRWRDLAADFFYPRVKAVLTQREVEDKVRECIRLAGFLHEQPGLSPPKTETCFLDCRPGALAEWASITARVGPRIETIRRDQFTKKGPGPPFEGRYGEAVKWLHRTARKQPRPSAADRAAALRLIGRARKLLRTPVAVQAVSLQYFRDDYPSSRIGRLTVFENSVLVSFANAIRGVVRDTGTAEHRNTGRLSGSQNAASFARKPMNPRYGTCHKSTMNQKKRTWPPTWGGPRSTSSAQFPYSSLTNPT